MPRHYKLKDRIAELNKHWNIRPTPEGTCGVQQSLEERLQLSSVFGMSIFFSHTVRPVACLVQPSVLDFVASQGLYLRC